MKTCSKCGEIKSISGFNKTARNKDGLFGYCKLCQAVADGERRLRNKAENAEVDPYAAEITKRCPGCGYELSRQAFYRDVKTKDGLASLCRACQQLYRDNHKEGRALSDRTWRQANPEKCAASKAKRRASKVEAGGEYTGAEFAALKEATGNACLCCGAAGDLAADHVIPLSKGGPNDISNIQPLCKSCNSTKGVKSTDYRRWLVEEREA